LIETIAAFDIYKSQMMGHIRYHNRTRHYAGDDTITEIMPKRISKEDYYMEIAKIVSMRSTCIRARAGTIIIKNDAIVSTGYSGAPRGEHNCCDLGKCERNELGIEPGKNYEICRSIHSETNAIINAARNGVSVLDGLMYVYFERLDGQKKKHGSPCLMCSRIIKNAGIKKVIFKEIV
jgi:dCMP deaminase